MRLFAADDASAGRLASLGLAVERSDALTEISVLCGADGWERVRSWRAAGHRHRVLLLDTSTASDAWALQPVLALARPDRHGVIAARHTLASRSTEAHVWLDGAWVDLGRSEIIRDGARNRLTPTERALIAYLASRPNREVSSEVLGREVWSHRRHTGQSEAVEATVKRLRKKLEVHPRHPRCLLTGPEAGYLLRVPARANAPDVQTPFVARPALRRRLETRLADGPVALVGPSGAGKSRLALAWMRGRALTRALWVDASRVSDLDGLRVALGAATSLTAVDFETFGEALRGAGIDAVVLDDVDGLADLSAVCAALAVDCVLTARHRRADVPDLLVGPMNPRQSRQLLRERGIDDRQISRVLRSSDGYPLSLELSVAQAGPHRPADAVDNLEETHRDGLMALSIFPGRFHWDGALALGIPAEVVDALIDRAVVQVTADGLQIPDAIRGVCHASVASEDAFIVQVTAHCRDELRDLQRGPLEALERLAARVDDIEHAWSLALGRDPDATATLAECLAVVFDWQATPEALRDRLERSHAAQPEHPGIALLLGTHLRNQDPDRALTLLAQAEQTGEGRVPARARLMRARVSRWCKSSTEALELLEPWPYAPMPLAEAEALYCQRGVLPYAELAKRLKAQVEAAAGAGQLAEAAGMGITLQLALHYAGDTRAALAEVEREASWVAMSPHRPELDGMHLQNAAAFEAALGRFEHAVGLQREAVRRQRRIDPTRARRGHFMLGILQLDANQRQGAREELDRFAAWSRAHGRVLDESQAREALARWFLDQGEASRALWESEEALALAPDVRFELGPRLQRSTALALLGRWDEARDGVRDLQIASATARRQVEAHLRLHVLFPDGDHDEQLREMARSQPHTMGLEGAMAMVAGAGGTLEAWLERMARVDVGTRISMRLRLALR